MAAFSDQEEKFLNSMFQLKTEIVELKKQLKEKDDEIAQLKARIEALGKTNEEELASIPVAVVAIPMSSAQPIAPSIAQIRASGGESKNSHKEPEIVMSEEEKKVIDEALEKKRNGVTQRVLQLTSQH